MTIRHDKRRVRCLSCLPHHVVIVTPQTVTRAPRLRTSRAFPFKSARAIWARRRVRPKTKKNVHSTLFKRFLSAAILCSTIASVPITSERLFSRNNIRSIPRTLCFGTRPPPRVCSRWYVPAPHLFALLWNRDWSRSECWSPPGRDGNRASVTVQLNKVLWHDETTRYYGLGRTTLNVRDTAVYFRSKKMSQRFCRVSVQEIQSWWEVPAVAHFCSLFRTAFNLPDFEIEVEI